MPRLLSILLLTACSVPPPDGAPNPGATRKLVWSDEFDGPAGTAPDGGKWMLEVGGGGWGNQQLEFNTDLTSNCHLDGNGALIMTARREPYGGLAYTSCRMRSRNLDQTYGRFEARIRLPSGGGIWPAFWLLGADYGTVGWPACGEIDIMEGRGNELATIHGSAHGPGYSGGSALTSPYSLPGGAHFRDDFHVFAVEWNAGRIDYFVDDVLYLTVQKDQLNAAQTWAFGQSMFIIFDLAVGGTFVGPVDDSVFPQSMIVDWVRVYEVGG
jgi:beta-glucanase (GH16 family)